MKVYNLLPHFLDCMRAWKTLPTQLEYQKKYILPIEGILKPMLDDFSWRFEHGFYPILEGLNWSQYREEVLTLDSDAEEQRLRRNLSAVENLFGFTLAGEVA